MFFVVVGPHGPGGVAETVLETISHTSAIEARAKEIKERSAGNRFPHVWIEADIEGMRKVPDNDQFRFRPRLA